MYAPRTDGSTEHAKSVMHLIIVCRVLKRALFNLVMVAQWHLSCFETLQPEFDSAAESAALRLRPLRLSEPIYY